MNTIAGKKDLETKIAALEVKAKVAKAELKSLSSSLLTDLKPQNLMRHSLNAITTNSGIKNTIVDAAIGVGAGLLTQKTLVGKSSGVVKNIVSSLTQMGVTALVTKLLQALRTKHNQVE